VVGGQIDIQILRDSEGCGSNWMSYTFT